jgi:hypothetical protein
LIDFENKCKKQAIQFSFEERKRERERDRRERETERVKPSL